MQASFENTVGILVKAYLGGVLLKGHCSACAVGNICAAALGAEVSVNREAQDSEERGTWSKSAPRWHFVFMTNMHGEQIIEPENYEENGLAKEQIDKTGYTYLQLARIEKAFETAGDGYTEEAEFAGLMAVVDVLAHIHGIDLTTAEAAKQLFVRV